MSDWDTLFDDLYLRTYASLQKPEDAEAQAEAVARLAGLEPGANVLDCPCGYGRHTIPLARAGYHVVGADRSEVLLEEARRRAGEAEWPKWVRADYRELPFEDASFDCCLNLFSSLGYWGEEGDRQARGEFRRVLRPGGSLVVGCTAIGSCPSSAPTAGRSCPTGRCVSNDAASTRSRG